MEVEPLDGEATAKAPPEPTPERVEDVFAGILTGKLDGGLFAECEPTLCDIRKVGEATRETSIGFLGPRIEHPS